MTDIGMPVPTSPGGVRVERVVTAGAFELDGGSWEVENNVWLVGDDAEVLVVGGGSWRWSARTGTTTT